MANIITPGLALKAAVPGDDRRGGALTTNNTVSETNKFGVDAVELNPNIEGSMAHDIAEVNSNLVNVSTTPTDKTFYADEQDGKLGINTDPSRGADTFYPFSSNPSVVIYDDYWPAGNKTVIAPADYKMILVSSISTGALHTFYTINGEDRIPNSIRWHAPNTAYLVDYVDGKEGDIIVVQNIDMGNGTIGSVNILA